MNTDVVCTHALRTELEEEGRTEQARTIQEQQRWPMPCLCDDKSELSLLTCLGTLFIQLYLSSPCAAHMLA